MTPGIHARGKTTATPAPSVSPVRTGLLQRKCACGGTPGVDGECAECRRKRLTKQARSVTRAEPFEVPPIVNEVLSSPGQPLDDATRAFMEPRFGHDFGRVRVHNSRPQTTPVDLTVGSANDAYEREADRVAQHIMRMPRSGLPEHHAPGSGYDFGGVRVHADARAAESARAINALAYTVGNHVVFGSGQYAPGSTAGRKLLAHELTHVVQQGSGKPAQVQRWSYGSGAPPHADYTEVPADHRARVEQGMNLVSRVVNNPKDYPACHKFFQTNCPGGTATTLIDKFNAATLWFDTDNSVWGSGVDPDHVAYSDATHRMGRWFIGSVMIHEFMHRCGQDDETINDRAIPTCGFRDVEIIGGKIVEKT